METIQVKIETRLQNNLRAALEYCLKHNLVISGKTVINVEDYLSLFNEVRIKEGINNCSKNRRKKLVKSLRRLEYKQTLKSINLFFHFLHTKLELSTKIKIDKSLKEQEIDKLRKKYQDLKKVTEEARIIFKESKKDFY
jgi:hypothetical protein